MTKPEPDPFTLRLAMADYAEGRHGTVENLWDRASDFHKDFYYRRAARIMERLGHWAPRTETRRRINHHFAGEIWTDNEGMFWLDALGCRVPFDPEPYLAPEETRYATEWMTGDGSVVDQ